MCPAEHRPGLRNPAGAEDGGAKLEVLRKAGLTSVCGGIFDCLYPTYYGATQFPIFMQISLYCIQNSFTSCELN